ncbi:MAG: FeoA family protein [Chloroflexota bacterium]
MKCSLCGLEYDENAVSCHAACPLARHCTVVCCPGCGYQTPDTSKSRLARSLRRVFGINHAPAPETRGHRCCLRDLATGKTGRVISVDTDNEAVAERLLIMGIMPGCDLTLVQRRPAIVVRAGYTELSLEDDIAKAIVMEVPA